MNRLVCFGLVLALFTATNALWSAPAQAMSYDYSVTGGITGTFNADLSLAGGSFNSWSLTTPIATFTNLTGTVISNTNFALFQTLGSNAFSFLLLSPTDNYTGIFSGIAGAGSLSGTFTQVSSSVPVPGTMSLMLVGLLALAAAHRVLAARIQ